eukprot:gene10140-11817_t
MKKIFFFIIASLFYINCLHAQDFEFGKISVEDIQIKRAKTDSNANAIVLKEFGTASIQIDENYGYSYVDYKYHVRIKILNKNGFEHGNIQIPLWRYTDRDDEITELTACTFSPSDGIMVRTDLDKKQIFLENRSKYLNVKKFAMPNLKEGSIIEYSYTLNKKNIFNFVTWEFQSPIPKIQSEFIAMIPAIYNFNASIRGFLKLTSQNAEISRECLRIQGSKIDCSKLSYIMKDIPAFIEESYMTAATNFRSAIYFELSDVQHLNGGKNSITKTWKDVDYELKNEKSFGGQMKRKDAFKEILPEILKDQPDELSKAKAIYAYIKKNIRWNRYYGKYGENAIKKSLETHSGNIGDINLALIAALSSAGLDAEALVLSTRENGIISDLYPVISNFNYVIAKINIADKSYLLDASEPLLPFGLLPLRCMNERGRVISLTKPSYWYDIKANQKDINRYTFTGSLSSEGKITGHLITYSSGYSAFNKRKKIEEAGSAELYAEKLNEQMPGLRILHHQISNIDSLDNPLVEDYEIEMKSQYDMKAGQIYFNPFFIDKTSKNPFNLNERTYPVDLGAAKEDRVTILLKIPDNFQLADHPKNLAIALAQNGGKYLTDVSFSDGVLNFTQLFQLNKALYGPDEYLSLKELFSRMIQQQKTDVILKKAI